MTGVGGADSVTTGDTLSTGAITGARVTAFEPVRLKTARSTTTPATSTPTTASIGGKP